MFYPVDTLRRGGRFYLLWLADSYPARFATIGNRQLWSNDIRKLCVELQVVIMSESGQANLRYSLRLSSQLMRGLVKLYRKKVDALLNDLCMIHAKVMKHSKTKYNIQEETEEVRRGQDRPRQVGDSRKRSSRSTGRRAPGGQRIEEIYQNTINVLANVEDITLREPVIPQVLLPNDGFGEENPEQALQLLGDRTVEMMLVPPEQSAHRSALELPALEGEKSHDKTRFGHLDVEMEMIPGLDTTLRPSVGVRQSMADFEKEIPEIPDVPLLPIPEVPDPQNKQQQLEDGSPTVGQKRVRETIQETTQLELEELEESEPRPKRPRRLIIDKKMELSSDFIRSRIQNPWVDTRRESMKVELRVPAEVYMSRPGCAGLGERSRLAPAITRLFMRNLGYIHRDSSTEREMEEGAMQRQRTRPMSFLERIQQEEPSQAVPVPGAQAEIHPEIPQEILADISMQTNVNLPQIEVDEPRDLPTAEARDISEMLTQKLQTLSQQERNLNSTKRVSDTVAITPPAKKARQTDSTVKDVQRKQRAGAENKENVPVNQQTPRQSLLRDHEERRLTVILTQEGLADMPVEPPAVPVEASDVPRPSRRQDSEGSETPLGSLDRTRVSLGDSDKTTDSMRVVKEEWGTKWTMIKIFRGIRNRKENEEINVKTLIALGPVVSGYKTISMAKCFSSILKLKQAGFINVIKHPETLEIKDIIPGPKLEGYLF